MRIELKLSEAEIESLWNQSAREGYIREAPRKAWTRKEMEEAIRWYLRKKVKELAEIQVTR